MICTQTYYKLPYYSYTLYWYVPSKSVCVVHEDPISMYMYTSIGRVVNVVLFYTCYWMYSSIDGVVNVVLFYTCYRMYSSIDGVVNVVLFYTYYRNALILMSIQVYVHIKLKQSIVRVKVSYTTVICVFSLLSIKCNIHTWFSEHVRYITYNLI